MKKKLTAEVVDALPAATDNVQDYYWDESYPGFGVVVGRNGSKTFVFLGRVRGVKGADGRDIKRRIVIGQLGATRPDGYAWTAKLARQAARLVEAELESGRDPNLGKRKGPAPMAIAVPVASGPTLRDGLVAHLARMRKKHRAERSIATFESEVTKHFAAWLDRPINELTGSVLVDLHEQIKKSTKARANSNRANEKGAPLANRVITHVSACWNSLNKKLEGQLGSWNPAKAVDKDALKPKRVRILDEDLPDYAARVATMRSPIRRDGLMLALFTGLRSEDIRTIRAEHVDWDARVLNVPDPKGGESKAFAIPLSSTAFEILERRRNENARDLGTDPAGWLFPAIGNDGVGPITDLREQRHEGKKKKIEHGRFPVEDVHTLRRTWESVAHEEGVSELDVHVLSNHSFASHNVNATYISQHLAHLATVAERIDAGMRRRLSPSPEDAKKKRHLKVA